MTDDHILVSRVIAGDVEAFEKIVDAYKNKLFSFLTKMTYSKQDSEEILQEVFIRVYNNLHKYNDQWSFSTWIYRITVNTCKSHMRKNKLRTVPINANMTAEENNPAVSLDRKEQHREIISLIRNLKEKQRIPLILKYVKGFSYYEISKIMGISEEAARMRVMRAKKNVCKKYWETHRGDLS